MRGALGRRGFLINMLDWNSSTLIYRDGLQGVPIL